MEIKYRIKRLHGMDNPQINIQAAFSELKTNKSISDQFINYQSEKNRFRSQIIKPVFDSQLTDESKSRDYDRKLCHLSRNQTFSRLMTGLEASHSPQLAAKNRGRSKTFPDSQSMQQSSSFKNKLATSLNQKHQQNTFGLKDIVENPPNPRRFPHYVEKSKQMIETKRKLLQMKHHIKMNDVCPILQSIQDSINQDKTGFTRKMKLELCRKGNYELIGFLEKDESLEKEKSMKSKNNNNKTEKSQRKQYKARNLPYLMSLQYRDQNILQKKERIQKMEETKKRLKAVRMTNIKKNT